MTPNSSQTPLGGHQTGYNKRVRGLSASKNGFGVRLLKTHEEKPQQLNSKYRSAPMRQTFKLLHNPEQTPSVNKKKHDQTRGRRVPTPARAGPHQNWSQTPLKVRRLPPRGKNRDATIKVGNVGSPVPCPWREKKKVCDKIVNAAYHLRFENTLLNVKRRLYLSKKIFSLDAICLFPPPHSLSQRFT
jgi:hypothetical protein